MKRLKKILKWAALVLGGLVALLLLANACWIWSSGKRLERQLAAIRAAGDPVTLADLARPPIPPEQNAATYVEQAKPEMDAIDQKLAPYYEWTREHQDCLLSPAMEKIVGAAFGAHPEVIPLLEKAAACPRCDANRIQSPAMATDDFSSSVENNIRLAARILQIRARLLASEGQAERALRIAIAVLQLSDRCEQNSGMLSYLVAASVRSLGIGAANMALQIGPVSAEMRRTLDAELALQGQRGAEQFVQAIKNERMLLDSMFACSPMQKWWCFRAYCISRRANLLADWQTLLPLAKKPRPLREIQADLKAVKQISTAMKHIFPAVNAAFTARASSQALVRCLRVLNAIQAHVPADSQAVSKLDALGLPVEATIDPFTGEPLHVKRLPNGWMVYSVGRNFQDDGGNLDFTHDIGVGPLLPTP